METEIDPRSFFLPTSNHPVKSMSTRPRNCLLYTVLAAVSLVAPAAVRAAVSLTVTPSIITNDYTGKIVLDVTGLTPGQSIQVQRFTDFNADGQVDAEDVPVEGFAVQDGQLPIIGGIRNRVVRGDEDATVDGKVRIEVSVPGIRPVLDLAVGTFVYRISGPSDGFNPVLRPFTVRATVLPQGVTGHLSAAVGGQPVAHALVVVLAPESSAGFTAFSDSNGAFTVYTDPGAYVVLPIKAGFIGGFDSGMATVTAGQILTNDLLLDAGALSVSGQLRDAVSGAGLPGGLVTAESSDGKFVVGFTDRTGAQTCG